MRKIAIGGIHGGIKALKQLIRRISLKENDQLIFLGDYVDGWSESAQTIDFLMNLQSKYSCIFIKGNHDVYCEKWLQNGEKPQKWLSHGGKSTIRSYRDYSSKQKMIHLNFIKSMKYYHIDGDNRLFIHAGFTSMHGPSKEVYESNYCWDRTLWEIALATDEKIPKSSLFFPKRLKLFKEIYIGHTPTTNYNSDIPMRKINVYNVDTGAAFKGKISGIDISTKEIFQSDRVQVFYPEEKGRN